MNRENWSETQIDYARIYSVHFISGKRSLDPDSPDFVPSVFCYSKPTDSKKLFQRYDRIKKRWLTKESVNNESLDSSLLETSVASTSVDPGEFGHDFCYLTTQTEEAHTQTENKAKEEASVQTEPEKKVLYNKIINDDSLINFYTGLPNREVFLWVLSLLDTTKVYICKKISPEEHLLLVLMKIKKKKIKLLMTDLSFRFKIDLHDVSRIYRKWVVILSEALSFLIIWPERDALRKNLPSCFTSYKDCVTIIDCTEIFIERPSSLQARAQTWSNYKHTTTIKYLIGITPAGAVMFLSRGWGGRVSDKEITIKSGFLEFLQRGDRVLADRGFLIAEKLAAQGAILTIPHFTKGKSQMSGKEVATSRKIANVRIHVERVIGRLRKFRILQSTIPITQVDLLDNVMAIVSALVNLNASVVTK